MRKNSRITEWYAQILLISVFNPASYANANFSLFHLQATLEQLFSVYLVDLQFYKCLERP